jgi:hypothetical protein
MHGFCMQHQVIRVQQLGALMISRDGPASAGGNDGDCSGGFCEHNGSDDDGDDLVVMVIIGSTNLLT